jgi:hypothetical protein
MSTLMEPPDDQADTQQTTGPRALFRAAGRGMRAVLPQRWRYRRIRVGGQAIDLEIRGRVSQIRITGDLHRDGLESPPPGPVFDDDDE